MADVVCDLGGVLVNLHWRERMGELLGRSVDPSKLQDLWPRLRSVWALETGRVEFNQFVPQFKQELDLVASEAAVAEAFISIVQAPKVGVFDILEAIRPHHRLSLLSNTNPPHVESRCDPALFAQFDHVFLSYQLGVMKPDPEIFHLVLRRLGSAPTETYFFDDGATNIQTARALGIQAFQVESPQKILETLRSLGAMPF